MSRAELWTIIGRTLMNFEPFEKNFEPFEKNFEPLGEELWTRTPRWTLNHLAKLNFGRVSHHRILQGLTCNSSMKKTMTYVKKKCEREGCDMCSYACYYYVIIMYFLYLFTMDYIYLLYAIVLLIRTISIPLVVLS